VKSTRSIFCFSQHNSNNNIIKLSFIQTEPTQVRGIQNKNDWRLLCKNTQIIPENMPIKISSRSCRIALLVPKTIFGTLTKQGLQQTAAAFAYCYN